ncbi:MAG: type III pantothenate kinase, partial [Paludibacter sp.]|nr:type III pantothenate kinase [Paludibacter sp.]
MNLCIDQGNSSTKVGVFDDNVLIDYFAIEELSEVEIEKLFERFSIDACIISSVTMKYDELLDILNKKNIFLVQLDHHTAVPIVNKYETPHTLGKDRLAAIVGAVYLEPETDLLIVDAGTAITYDLVDANGVYWGGNIAPGLSMRLRSLHEFTQKLPLVAPVVDIPLIGN